MLLNHEFVKDWMTTPPIAIQTNVTLPDAHAMMREHAIRRLPVINDRNQVIGIVSLSDILEAEPSDATSLSIYELNYLLAKLTIDKIMTRKVIIVTPDTTIAQAARLMRDHKIGGLPVVEKGHLVGIITESDIFRMVVEATDPVHHAVP